MEIIKKYVAVQVIDQRTNDDVNMLLTYGNRENVYEEFDTEEEAIEYAYKRNKWQEWLIIPKIRFNNY